MKILQMQNRNIEFKSIDFQNYNSKFSDVRDRLHNELKDFSAKKRNVSKIGEGVSGETYKFTDSRLSNFVVKTTKNGCQDDYEKEYQNLLDIPSDKIGGQEGVARVYDSSSGKYYLVSTLVEGKPASVNNRYSNEHLKNLFDKMFELDKAGIYHGDLNGKNILLNNSGKVNFIDYQWTQFVPQCNFYDNEKITKMLLPRDVFPENAQMFEMASMPYYIEKIWTSSEKENFLRKYLQAKAEYHEKRAKYIASLEPDWYSSEKHLIRKSLNEEKAKAKIYRNPDDDILKIELKKLQFLSDYRDAYSHVDGNLPDRNILGSSSSYLCAMSSVQDYRKTVADELRYCYNSDKSVYLQSMADYGDYWFSNLKEFTSDTFDYVIRAITNQPNDEENRHRFYINDRNPRDFSPNRDILKDVSYKFRTSYDRNFDVPYNISGKIDSIYNQSVKNLISVLYDPKSLHQIDKVKSVVKESKNFNENSKYLDLLNVSQVGTLKIREFRGHVRHNVSSYSALTTLNTLLDRSVEFTQKLFKNIFNGLKQESANSIIVKGYEGMRRFRVKV